MDTIATEQCAWMVRWGMSDLGIGITPPPGQDGGAIDNEVTGTDQSTADGDLHCQDKQRLPHWGTGSSLSLPMLGGTGHARLALGSERQPTSESQRRPPA